MPIGIIRLGGKDKSDSFRHLIKEELKQREKEEGYRLLYVAMTRAEEHLVLSFSTNRKKPQNWAAVLTDSLGLDLEAPCDRTVDIAAPGGERVPCECAGRRAARPVRAARTR